MDAMHKFDQNFTCLKFVLNQIIGKILCYHSNSFVAGTSVRGNLIDFIHELRKRVIFNSIFQTIYVSHDYICEM